MHLFYRNINDAFTNICRGFRSFGTGSGRYGVFDHGTGPIGKQNLVAPISREPSRYGEVLTIEEPVTITYTNPLERVLFHPIRDCNPFFHLIEALWMLAGQNRVQPLSYFVKKMEEFSDDDLTTGEIPYRGQPLATTDFSTGYMWGAYGYRWRNWFKHDQLEEAISILRTDRKTRRVVIEMWDSRDLHRVLKSPQCRDVPCNLLVMFRPRPSTETERYHLGQIPSPREQRVLRPVINSVVGYMEEGLEREDENAAGVTLLDMTVINRSNDSLWGALGSNYVHFSFLHEYIANSVGMAVGHYHQVTNNLHIYTSSALTGEKRRDKQLWSGQWEPDSLCADNPNPYDDGYRHYPLFRCPVNDLDYINQSQAAFDTSCNALFGNLSLITLPDTKEWCSPFFQDVVQPMLLAYAAHKKHNYAKAFQYASQIIPMDWRLNCTEWLRRRSIRYTKASDGGANSVHV